MAITKYELRDKTKKHMKEIKKDKPYRQIYEETGVSVTTVGRVARCIMLGANGYNLIFERVKNNYHAKKKKIKNSDTKTRSAKS